MVNLKLIRSKQKEMETQEFAKSAPPLKKWLFILGVFVVAAAALWFFALRPMSQPNANQSAQPNAATDSTPPKIALQGIADAGELHGTVTLKVDVTDNRYVIKVEYYIDGEFMGVSYAAPFELTLDTAKLGNGDHIVTAKAYDAAGNVANSKDMTIIVANKPADDSSPSATDESAAAQGRTTMAGQPAAQTANSSPGSSNSGSSSPGNGSSNSSDGSAPSVPGGLLLAADDGYTANLSWTASTDNVAVIGYKIFRNGLQIGTSASNSYKDQTVVPGNTYEYKVSAYDTASNESGGSSEPSITLVTTSMWIAGDTPANLDNDASDYELGVKFRPLVNGKVAGIRFYKGAGNTGAHVGRLWSSSGTPLANAAFGSETSEGWQSVTFGSPVDVTAGTTYVASYSAPNGHPSYTSSYFATTGITSQYLTALASGVDGNNGVFNTTAGSFPSTSFSNTNYWVDVSFIPNAAAAGPNPKVADTSKIYTGYPGSDNTGVTVGRRLPTRDRKIDVVKDGVTVENIEDNFVHDLLYFALDHNDSFLMTGGDNMTLTHNTFHNTINQTAALGLFCDFSAITNVTATNNLLIGGGYAAYGGGGGPSCTGSHHIKFLNNKFSREAWPNGGFNGPVTGYNGAQTGSQWSGNVWFEDGVTVNP